MVSIKEPGLYHELEKKGANPSLWRNDGSMSSK